MSKIGRNDPCPCGSGKKYKKCCLDNKESELNRQRIMSRLNEFMSYEEVDAMTTPEIIEKLQSFGIPFEKDEFLRDIEEFYSAQELSENWLDTFGVTVVGRDEDFPWFAAWVLWERLAPKHMLSMEQMSDIIDKGYALLRDEGDSKSASDIWLKVWDAIKYRIKPEFTNLDYLHQHYEGSFFIHDFCQDLQCELFRTGIAYSQYFEKCIEYCNEFCSYFPDEDEFIVHSMRRAVAESYLVLNKIDKAKKEFDSLVSDYPNNLWTFIAYGDMYCFKKDIIYDSSKARELYEKARLVAKSEADKWVVEDRLEDLNNNRETWKHSSGFLSQLERKSMS